MATRAMFRWSNTSESMMQPSEHDPQGSKTDGWIPLVRVKWVFCQLHMLEYVFLCGFYWWCWLRRAASSEDSQWNHDP
eukprot:scaffold64950_cov67-Attheya_sp.AAC.1